MLSVPLTMEFGLHREQITGARGGRYSCDLTVVLSLAKP
jgi:hypothetical protein